MTMPFRVFAITAPKPINVLYDLDENGDPIGCRILSDTAYLRTIGGMKKHYHMIRQGRVHRVDHVEYRRNETYIRPDALGRQTWTVDLATIILMANLTDDWKLARLFEYRDHAKRFVDDYMHLGRFIEAMQLSQARSKV